MDNKAKKIGKTIVYFLGLLLVYYLLAVVVNRYWYKFPLYNPEIYWYYVLSRLLDWLNVKIFLINIPHELLIIVNRYGWRGPIIPAWGYHILIDKLPNYWIFTYFTYYFWIALLTSIALANLTTRKTPAKNVRGARIATQEQLAKILKQAQAADTSGSPGLYADPIILPGEMETRHTLTAGSTGTGKSVMLCQLISCMVKRRGKMVIYDRKGELYAKFGTTNDILWNPYDVRSCNWNIFAEFDLYAGLDRMPDTLSDMADSLFSIADEHSKPFYNGAASIFKSGCCYLKIHKMETNKDLYHFFTSGAEAIAAAIETLPVGLQEGKSFLIGGGDVAASYMGCLMDRVKWFQALIGLEENGFSVGKWIKNTEDKRALYLSAAGGGTNAESPILTLWIDLVGKGILQQPENNDRRTYMVIDEFSSLPPLKTLKMLLREGRSKGVSILLTTQTMSAIEGKYGKDDAADIMGLCNSLFVFRTGEPAQSEYFSRAMGDAERIKLQKSRGENQRAASLMDVGSTSKNVNEHNAIERLFLPGELQSLPIGCAVVKIADYPVAKVKFHNILIKEINKGFVAREIELASDAEIAAAAAAVGPTAAPADTEPAKGGDVNPDEASKPATATKPIFFKT
jgi:type IV secretory pathway TraG/TraD family ATPase VirD4